MTTATPNPAPRDIAAVDVSTEQVESEAERLWTERDRRIDARNQRIAARRRKAEALRLWNATPERFAELAAHPVRADAGHLDEYRHLLHDEDPDSTTPAIRVNLTKHQARRPS